MKIFYYKIKWFCPILILLGILIPNVFSAQADLFSNINQPQIVWGAETNGCGAGIAVYQIEGQQQSCTVTIYLRLNLLVDTNFPSFQTNQLKGKLFRGTYFWATNMFYGFIELHDSKGVNLLMYKPELNSSNAYPAFYSLSVVRANFSKNYLYSGPGLPPISLREGQLPPFKPNDYFKIPKSDEYQLTVWPKIYKRTETNSDICQRIDLPSVTVPIKWEDNTQN